MKVTYAPAATARGGSGSSRKSTTRIALVHSSSGLGYTLSGDVSEQKLFVLTAKVRTARLPSKMS